MTKAEIQRVRSLHDKAGRDEHGLFVVEGPKVVDELLAVKYPFEAVYATPTWDGPGDRSRITKVTAAEMGRMSHFPTPSSVLALARIVERKLPAKALDQGWTLALDGIQDPGNVGTMLRVADWYGVERVLLSPGCADPHSPKVIDSSMGSFARIPVYTVDLPKALAGTRAQILGCDLFGEDIHSLPKLSDVVIVIGSEGRGLSGPILKIARRVTIPRHGAAESLNAAVAAAVVCDVLR